MTENNCYVIYVFIPSNTKQLFHKILFNLMTSIHDSLFMTFRRVHKTSFSDLPISSEFWSLFYYSDVQVDS